MPKLDPKYFGTNAPSSPAKPFHSHYEARLLSPCGRMHSPRRQRPRSTSLEGIRRLSSSSLSDIPSSPRTPTRSKNIYSDRFIPSRRGSDLDAGFSLVEEPPRKRRNSGLQVNNNIGNTINDSTSTDTTTKTSTSAFSMLLKSELLGVDSVPPRCLDDDTDFTSSGRNLFKFKAARERRMDEVTRHSMFSPVSNSNRLLFSSPRTAQRKIPKAPFKVLDAPSLQDDFYLNLVDWSSTNILAVGLGSCVYLWSACTSKVSKLCDLGPHDCVTSVAWTQRGNYISIGTNQGAVQIWDPVHNKHVRTMLGHTARVGTLAWNNNTLASGSRDRTILLRDLRQASPFTEKLLGHKQEVCGLKWSFDNNQLASGGNDNKLMIWNAKSSLPVTKFSDHCAAVKAIAWSPHQHGLLSSGGGTADRCIRFWNTLTGTALNCIDTGSQVCNLMWAKNVNEVVSTHGYSLNQIIVWRYPSMTKLATLTGHTFRVLYLAMSPDGQTIVTGAGDETLRFWNTFPGTKNDDRSRFGTTLLFPIGADIR